MKANKNKLYKILICYLLVFIAFGCKKSVPKLNVDFTILQYDLDLESGGYLDLRNSNWKSNGKIYANRGSDRCLIILINKKGDTILTHFDKGIEQWNSARMFKSQGEYFVVRRDFNYVELDSTVPWYKELPGGVGQESYNDIDLPIDSYYKLDSVNRKLVPVRLVPNEEVLQTVKRKTRFKTGVAILASSNNYTFIAKDTLKGSQVYYQIDTQYTPRKKDTGWVLAPSKMENISKLGIYQDNITSYTQNLGSTFVNIFNDTVGRNMSRYDIDKKEYRRFSYDKKRYIHCDDEIFKLEVILQDRTKKAKKIIATLTDGVFIENTDFKMFKYKNGDYFIGVLPTPETEYKHSLLRLDTIHWKLDRVTAYDKKIDSKMTRYKKDKGALISGDVSEEMSLFLEAYEIVKVNDGFRLITLAPNRNDN